MVSYLYLFKYIILLQASEKKVGKGPVIQSTTLGRKQSKSVQFLNDETKLSRPARPPPPNFRNKSMENDNISPTTMQLDIKQSLTAVGLPTTDSYRTFPRPTKKPPVKKLSTLSPKEYN